MSSIMNAQKALAALAEKPTWLLDELPAGITEDILRVLDDDGHLEFRPRWNWKQRAFPNLPKSPPRGPWPYGWISPNARPTLAGTWSKIFELMSKPGELIPEVRINEKGRAALARQRLADTERADPAPPDTPGQPAAHMLRFMQGSAKPKPHRRDPVPVRPKPVRDMLDALIDLEIETDFVVELMEEAIVWISRISEFRPPMQFKWDDVPSAEDDPVRRQRAIEQRQTSARGTCPIHARLSNIRDRMFYTVQDWRSHLHRARALIPTITEWTDRKDDPAIDRWSANLREELGVLGGVIHPDFVGDLPRINRDSVEDLKTAIAKISERIDDLKRIGPEEPAEPLTPMVAIEVLDARPSWFLNKLPSGVTLDVLRVLDADRFIEVRHLTAKNQAEFRGDPTPPLTQTSEWYSPTLVPTNMGTWDTIFKVMARGDRHAPELRVTDKARAELARRRLAARDTDAAPVAPTRAPIQAVVVTPEPWCDQSRSVEDRLRYYMAHLGKHGQVTRPSCRDVAAAIRAGASSVTETKAWEDWGMVAVPGKEVQDEDRRQPQQSKRVEAERISQEDGDD
ncbi:MAG: hypothetical protein IT436_12110 [Phycisphaerales bacterium]|nr:hypothetical protein [Phycisphaerales bacterium]